MKKCLIAIAMVLALSMNAEAAAQKHRHTPRTEQVDSTKNNQDAIEAFSDTTNVADEDDSYSSNRRVQVYSDEDVEGVMKQVFGHLDGEDVAGMLFVLLIILTIFFLAPIGIIIAIFYFVNKNRRERYKLAQMAMQNGQPIPDELLKEQKPKDDWERNDYAAGMRQLFLGIGLAIFLGYAAGKIGFGIGALVFFIGLGKVIIAKTSGKKDIDINNNNLQNYD